MYLPKVGNQDKEQQICESLAFPYSLISKAAISFDANRGCIDGIRIQSESGTVTDIGKILDYEADIYEFS